MRVKGNARMSLFLNAECINLEAAVWELDYNVLAIPRHVSYLVFSLTNPPNE